MIHFKPFYLFSFIFFGSLTHTELLSVPGCPRKCGNQNIPLPFGMNVDDYFHIIVVFLGIFLVAPLLVTAWIAWTDRQKKLQKRREDRFEQNGGSFLQRKLSRRRNKQQQQLSIYTVEDMKSITNNYSIKLRYCHGDFHRGTLSNGDEVAVVMIKRVPQSQIKRFVDQLIFLSQPHKKNLVRLIGCCLETHSPLLVYELHGDNGAAAATLFDCTRDRALASHFSCEMRVKAAAGVARGLAYLNMHGNICSANIVMDTHTSTSFDAKIFFAAGSNLIPSSDQENYVYKDPDFISSGRLNNKSDVYSFGVVLVELLTGGRTLSPNRRKNDRNMALHFVHVARAGRLREILDEEMSGESDAQIVREFAILAQKCLNVKPGKRPNMKQVAAKLSMLMMQRE